MAEEDTLTTSVTNDEETSLRLRGHYGDAEVRMTRAASIGLSWTICRIL
jgi:hypothetical protein